MDLCGLFIMGPKYHFSALLTMFHWGVKAEGASGAITISLQVVRKSNASICFTCCVLGGILVSVVRVCNAAVNDGKICSGASMQ